MPPVSDGSGQDRTLLRKASQLLQEAGLPVKDDKRLLPNGEVFTIEFLLDEVSFQPHHATFIKNLGQLGIEAGIRQIDAVQYRARVEDFDFDVTTERLSMSATPGDSVRPYFSSQAAATKGSYNLAGIANPAIDALIEKIIGADDRVALTHACRALDRVFRAGRYWVPQWYRTTHPLAYWDVFDHPKNLPRYQRERLFHRSPGAHDLVVRCRQGRQARAGEIIHERLYRPPHPADDPDAARDPLRVVRGRAVRAGRAGGTRDRPALRRGYRRHLAHFRRRRRFRCARSAGLARRPTRSSSKYRGAQGLDPDFIKSLEKQFGFDKPAPERFALMLWNFARFDFGKSYFRDVSVMQLIKEKLPVSMSLGIWMTLLTYLISIPLGIRKAVKDGSRFDTWTSAVIIVGYAIPGFLFAILLIILFAGGSFFNIFPLRGLTSDGWAQFPWYWKIIDYFWHLTLPLISMALSAFATMTLLTKNSFLDEIRKQYVMTARAKGCSETQVLYNHIFRNAMLIVIAGFPSAFISSFFHGALLIETIFSLDGLGLLSFESVLNRDYPVVFGTLYIFSLLGLVVNLISDLAYMWVDPRIDFEAREV